MGLFRKDRSKPEIQHVRTQDGWRLCTYRYRPDRPTSPWGPVLLMHGLSSNRYDLDAPDPRISLARYLNERGHDVWVAELRGAGRSRAPGWPLRWLAQFDFDDYVHRDVPALMRRVLDDSGSSALHWVGHSLGGMLAYAALEHLDQALFRSVVTIGSPAFTAMKHPLVDKLYRLKFLLNVLPYIPNRPLARIASLAPSLIPRRLKAIFTHPDNMTDEHVQMLLRYAQSTLPARLMAQFARWYGEPAGFARSDGLMDYYAHMGRIKAPMLIITGAGDQLTPVEELRWVYEAIGSADKKLLICGKACGFSEDYGHIDTVLGIRARQEVYPHIADWIESHVGEWEQAEGRDRTWL